MALGEGHHKMKEYIRLFLSAESSCLFEFSGANLFA